jgi:hypothetical protein
VPRRRVFKHSRLFDTLKWRGRPQVRRAERRRASNATAPTAPMNTSPNQMRTGAKATGPPPTARIVTDENLYIVAGVDFLANDLDVAHDPCRVTLSLPADQSMPGTTCRNIVLICRIRESSVNTSLTSRAVTARFVESTDAVEMALVRRRAPTAGSSPSRGAEQRGDAPQGRPLGLYSANPRAPSRQANVSAASRDTGTHRACRCAG